MLQEKVLQEKVLQEKRREGTMRVIAPGRQLEGSGSRVSNVVKQFNPSDARFFRHHSKSKQVSIDSPAKRRRSCESLMFYTRC